MPSSEPRMGGTPPVPPQIESQDPGQRTCHKNALCSLIPSNCDNLGPSADLPPHCSPLFQIIKTCIKHHRPSEWICKSLLQLAGKTIPTPCFRPPSLCCAFPCMMGRFPSHGYARCVSQDPSHPVQNQGWNFYVTLWGGAGAAAVLASCPGVLQRLSACVKVVPYNASRAWERHLVKFLQLLLVCSEAFCRKLCCTCHLG